MTEHPVGVFAGKTNAEYDGGPGYSKSSLDIIRRSPAHLKNAQDQRAAGVESEETAAMRVGCAEHGVLLQADPSVQILDDLKAMYAEDAAGKTILTPAQWRDVRGMRDAVIEHP